MVVIFLIYMLKSTLCLAIFYLFYRWLLSKETFHRFNRLALLGILVLSWLVPLVEVTPVNAMGISRAMWALEDWLLMAEANQYVSQEDMFGEPSAFGVGGLLLLYAMGSLCFFLQYLFSLGKMFLLLHRCREERRADGVRVFIHQEEMAPFSWMRFVVMSEKDRRQDGEIIWLHEYAHVSRYHSWDLLLANLCVIFQWFNPAAWLLKEELQHVHEYEADAFVMAQGIDAKEYQLLLIKKAVGTRLYSMANSLNHSSLKKRISMMIKKKSNPWARLKLLYVLPLVIVSGIAFARPDVKVNDLALNAKAIEAKSMKKESESSLKRPIVFVDGKIKSESDIKSIHPETIESMYVWKGEAAIGKYGEIGKYGVIEIELKKGGT